MTHHKHKSIHRYIAPIILFFFGLGFSQDNDLFDSEECVDCHEDVILDDSMHEDFDCGDCHGSIIETGIDHSEEGGAHFKDVCDDCSECHEDAAEVWVESAHGVSLYATGSEKEAAHCWSCHGGHDIQSSDMVDSKTYPLKLAETCGECHARPELVEKYNIPNLHPVELFSKSYHAKVMSEGHLQAATCNDCHGTHDIRIGTDPTSTISHANVSKTCGQCHEGIFDAYEKSVHWQALIRGERESPACVDCHGEHEIIESSDPNSPVSKRRSAEETCARCHQDDRLVQKYGLDEGKISSYQDSYHGLAVMNGDENSATCYDCHGAHAILDLQNPLSSIHDNNLKETCEKCHPNASDSFAQSYTHKSVQMADRPVEWYVKMVYIFLIVGTVGGMFIHNGIILYGHIRLKYQREKTEDYIQRYTKSQVIQHYILMISFFTLVLTGFALKFSQSFWVEGLTWLGMDEAVRSLLHRVAAVILIVLSMWHVFELILFKSGRQLFSAFLPRLRDFKLLGKTLKYALIRQAEKPSQPRFDYTEKVEYWALIWGTIIMILSGFILWFPEWFGRFNLPWLIKVSEVFHYYEAWLASLSILVWHMFFVLFHPKEYPLSLTWLHGRMSITEYKEKHLEDYENIMSEVEAVKRGELSINQCCFQAAEFLKRYRTIHS
ncbi:MAG: cytochrome b/b6 domain-containing protein [Candidatus Marinimicrobia bacterium]|nr:cytochrome b/b6 domain-containing protein [Candidatus Neomarinimicrobiota bacterium]MBL7010237.1 cytochrome b/b6 domain-containing protein [Candidatus Neomarinimicrobiota bacterium]MBL7030652.1 cytochrome b/b6 domain-containing protein [Candidatus Neomarinimicrobiota bacterium]